MLPATIPTLDGGSVRLRPFADRDRPVVVAAGTDPLIPLITSVPARGDEAAVVAYLDRQHARLAEGAGYSFAVADAATDEAVGQIGLWTRELADGRASTGYWIAPQHRRRGHARAALRTLTEWAFTHDEVQRLQLFVEPWNEGSRRAAEACGFVREGLLRSWQRVGPERRDMVVYARVRPLTPGGSAPSS